MYWTKEQEEQLCSLWKDRSDYKLEEIFGRSLRAISTKARMLQITADKPRWSAANITLAVAMWKLGHTSGDIGDKVGKTRSAVLGLVHRLGLQKGRKKRQPRPKKARVANKPVKLARRKPHIKAFKKPAPLLSGKEVSLLDRTRTQCSYIVAPQTCCGQESYYRSSWCEYHYKLVYRRDAA